jgi:hypothetical protein
MIRADEIRKGNGQIQFSLLVLESKHLRLKKDAVANSSAPSGRTNELRLSAFQVLVACVSAFCVLGLLVWALLRLWLFEP